MARRKKTSLAQDLMDLVALLPWWAGIGLAIASYLLMGALAARPIGGAGPGNLVGAVVNGLATAGQVVLPILGLAGAAVSAYRRHQRQTLLADAAQAPAANALDGMRWQDFEKLVGEAFRQRGYQVLETGGGGADGGVDLVLSRPARNGTEKTLVQCKQWRAYKVGVDVVRELYGVMTARGAAAGIVATAGRFTDEARAFAQGRNVQLMDGPAFHRLIREVQPQGQPEADTANAAAPEARRGTAPAPLPVTATDPAPACPTCGKTMVQRTAQRGANAGSRFWGCTGYPACRGTRKLGEG